MNQGIGSLLLFQYFRELDLDGNPLPTFGNRGDGFLEITTIPTQGPIEISVVISVYIRKKI